MGTFQQIKNDIKEVVSGAANKSSLDYDTTAEVVRVEGNTAWVHIPGGVDETPVEMSVNAKAGDTVRVRVSDGQAFLNGNNTAPPTDDTTANKAIADASKANNEALSAIKSVSDLDHSLDQDDLVKRITNNYEWQGIYVDSDTGNIYINASYIHAGTISADMIYGGTLTLGGAGNVRGTLVIKDENGNNVVQMNKDGADITGSIKTNNGNIALDGSMITFAHSGNNYGGIRAKWTSGGSTNYYDFLTWTYSSNRPELTIGGNAKKITIGDPGTGSVEMVTAKIDTLETGSLLVTTNAKVKNTDPYYYTECTAVDSQIGKTIPSQTVSLGGFSIQDKNQYDTAWIVSSKDASDSLRFRLGFRRVNASGLENIDHHLSLYIDSSGTRSVVVTDPAAWRSGLGAPPTSHASSASTYGLGTTANYGHVKTINSLSQSSHANGTALSAYQGYVLNWHMANGNFTVRFKTGTINLADGTSGAKTATINLTSTDVPSGYGVWYVLVTLGNYQLPYHSPSNSARYTYVSDVRSSSITITNTSTAWSSYTYYLTIILHKT